MKADLVLKNGVIYKADSARTIVRRMTMDIGSANIFGGTYTLHKSDSNSCRY